MMTILEREAYRVRCEMNTHIVITGKRIMFDLLFFTDVKNDAAAIAAGGPEWIEFKTSGPITLILDNSTHVDPATRTVVRRPAPLTPEEVEAGAAVPVWGGTPFYDWFHDVQASFFISDLSQPFYEQMADAMIAFLQNNFLTSSASAAMANFNPAEALQAALQGGGGA